VLRTSKGAYVVLDFVVDEDIDEVPRTFVANFAVIVESNPERDSLLLIEDDWPSATFNNGSGHLLGFSVGMTEQTWSSRTSRRCRRWQRSEDGLRRGARRDRPVAARRRSGRHAGAGTTPTG
jgi:hypothetical protein